MRTNVAVKHPPVVTHEGGRAIRQDAQSELLRSVASCLLFENTFYESGNDLADRIGRLAAECPVEFVNELAVYARHELKLRHVPLWLLAHQAKRDHGLAETIEKVIKRADELAELVALYWRVNPAQGSAHQGAPLSAQMKKGLARAFRRFDEYALAKYDRANAVRLRDVLFLCHAKPKDKAQARLWKRLVENKLESPDTWEVALSGGAGKRKTFTRLLKEKKLGYLAVLRNLRNMDEAQVDRKLVADALFAGAAKSGALPFQFVAAWRFAPAFGAAIEAAMLAALGVREEGRLGGSTAVVVDVSGSMDGALSDRSKLSRIDAASALAVAARELCADVRVFTFSNNLCEIPAARGLGLIDGIAHSQPHSGTQLAGALKVLLDRVPAKRLIVITDEQSHDGIQRLSAGQRGYLINVATYKPALDTSGGWTRINGFSERILDFIAWEEKGYAFK